MTAVPAPSVAAPEARRRVRARHWWLIPGLAIAVYANAVASTHDLGLAPLLLFGIIPHLTVLLGLGQPHGRRQLGTRAVTAYNVMHHPAVPMTMAGVAAMGIIGPFWLVGAIAWLSHIVVDWALGDGLRSRDGFLLGPVGRLVGFSSLVPAGGGDR